MRTAGRGQLGSLGAVAFLCPGLAKTFLLWVGVFPFQAAHLGPGQPGALREHEINRSSNVTLRVVDAAGRLGKKRDCN